MVVLEIVEEGWWKGRIGQKEGVFPSNFVEEIAEDAMSEPPSHNGKPVPAPQSETVDHTPAPGTFIALLLLLLT